MNLVHSAYLAPEYLRNIIDLKTGSGIALAKADIPALEMIFAHEWSELCEFTIAPVANDEDAMETISKESRLTHQTYRIALKCKKSRHKIISFELIYKGTINIYE